VFSLAKPDARTVAAFLERQAGRAPSAPIGLARRGGPGFSLDVLRVRLGQGADLLARARGALERWEIFRLPWVELVPARPRLEPGTDLAVVARHAGFWSINACRIVYLVAEEESGVERSGFAYGTLPDHAERGEEIFAVELDAADDGVWYHVRAASRPNAWLSWLGYPLARRLQRRFRDESAAALRRALATGRR
jgi:uncharacterized protein (UPF0548 family)